MKEALLKYRFHRGYVTIFKTGQKYFISQRGEEGTDLSAGVVPLFAPAAQPALSPFLALSWSQMPFHPHELVLQSLCPVWGKGAGG